MGEILYDTSSLINVYKLKIGKPIPAIDIIIAAVALNRNMKLVTTDNHFAVIRKIRSDFEFVIENKTLKKE
ncbi:MAG: PIN domain-containing protein [Methanophagales archaeon]|nr:PIN domain-containing protein [Methanophagales archaeon]